MFKKNSELSASIEHDFRPDLVTQEGLTGPISALAYDPVQSLFAVGTETGLIHVMGAGEIRCVLDPNPKHKTSSSPITFLRFVTSVYLVSVDDRSLIVVWALDTRQEWARYQCPYSVMSCWTDPAMDWLFMGHRNGETTAFDIDRGHTTPFKIPYLEREVNPKSMMAAVKSVSLHPRDPALLLLCYHDVALVYNIIKGEVVYSMTYEYPLMTAVWHPSGSHVATAHVNGYIIFWDGTKGVRLGARNAFPASVESMDLDRDRIAEGLAWCCREDPTDTFLVAWGGRNIGLTEFGPTPTVATSSYESMGNFFKSDDHPMRELQISSDINIVQIIPQNGNPHFQGCYNPSYAVVQASGQLLCVTLPALQVNPFDSAVLPAALSWRAAPITSLSVAGITRNQWIGMMAAALPNTKVLGGNSATQQLRKLQQSTVLCVGYSNGAVKLFDATRADSRDYRIVMTSVVGLDPKETDCKIKHVSLGQEVGEMAIATASGNVFMASFGKNRRPTRPAPPTPSPKIVNVEHLVKPELTQGFIPQFHFFNRTPVSALCNSNIGFVAVGLENSELVVIDKRGPAVIMEETIKGIPTCMEFGIVAMGEDSYSSILLSVGTRAGDVYIFKVVPRPDGGYQVVTQSKEVTHLSVGKEPVTFLAHVDTKEGKSAAALPDIMARLASGLQVQGGLVAGTIQEARFFALSGPKVGKKLGTKTFDTPLLGSTYAFLRWGTSSALVTVNQKGKVGIYGLPGFKTLSTYNLSVQPAGKVTISQMGDAFIPYNPAMESGQIIRVFGTDYMPKDDDVWQLKRRVPARPAISTAHWVSGRQFVRPADLERPIAGKRRGKSKRVRHQLVDEQEAPADAVPVSSQKSPKNGGGLKSWFGGGSPSKKYTSQHRGPPQKSWGQTFNEYYESAEDTVNGALDEAMTSMNTGKSSAQSSAVKGIIGSKLGF